MTRADLQSACIAAYGRKAADVAAELGITTRAVYERWFRARANGDLTAPKVKTGRPRKPRDPRDPERDRLEQKLRNGGLKGEALRQALEGLHD